MPLGPGGDLNRSASGRIRSGRGWSGPSGSPREPHNFWASSGLATPFQLSSESDIVRAFGPSLLFSRVFLDTNRPSELIKSEDLLRPKTRQALRLRLLPEGTRKP